MTPKNTLTLVASLAIGTATASVAYQTFCSGDFDFRLISVAALQIILAVAALIRLRSVRWFAITYWSMQAGAGLFLALKAPLGIGPNPAITAACAVVWLLCAALLLIPAGRSYFAKVPSQAL